MTSAPSLAFPLRPMPWPSSSIPVCYVAPCDEVTGPKATGGGAWTERFSWNGFDKAVGTMLKEVAKRRPQP